MGTETYLNQFEPIALQDDTVKLNNPQMGTETRVNQQFWPNFTQDRMLN